MAMVSWLLTIQRLKGVFGVRPTGRVVKNLFRIIVFFSHTSVTLLLGREQATISKPISTFEVVSRLRGYVLTVEEGSF